MRMDCVILFQYQNRSVETSSLIRGERDLEETLSIFVSLIGEKLASKENLRCICVIV